MACHLVLEESLPGMFNPAGSGNFFLVKLLGAKTITVVPKGSDMAAEVKAVSEAAEKRGAKTYSICIPGGVANEIGALGYARCGQEVAEQLEAQGLSIREVIVPSGSAGTHAGFLTGLRANGCRIPVRGICVSEPKTREEDLVYSLVECLAQRLDIDSRTVERDEIVCDDTQIGPGYSQPTPEMMEAVILLARTEGILLDPVYSGKTMAGLISYVRSGRYAKEESVLFLHTGGVPGLFDYVEVFNPHIEVPLNSKL